MEACPVSCVENLADDKTLTVVVPFRMDPSRPELLERLRHFELDTDRPDDIEILVVDDGSAAGQGTQVKALCKELGFAYLRIESEMLAMAIGRSRNIGAMHARSPFIFFQDADLMPCLGFYRDLLQEIEVRELRERNDDFLMIPVVYLTKAATVEFDAVKPGYRKSTFIQALLTNDKTRVEKFSSGTSACVYSRLYYLARGGNDPGFVNWGYEDLEFNTRMIRRLNRFPLPRDWHLDYRNFSSIVEYRGWKSAYRLMGDMCMHKGLVLFHAWHEVNTTKDYWKNTSSNRDVFMDRMLAYEEEEKEPSPLPSKSAGRSVLFRKNAFTWQREFVPMLGDVVFEDEKRFARADDFLNWLREAAIDRVIFHNPVVTPQMKMLYDACRENNITYVVCERGALRDSVFFDPSGFNADSSSYDASHWDHPLTEEQTDSVMRYISQERSVADSLEAQGDRLGDRLLLQKLGILPEKKILFVPYQRPGDTVITHHCGPIETFDNFLKLVRETAAKLPPDWVVVTKRHPLEDEIAEAPGVVQANDANIKDLLDVADALLLINSGVGVLGMIWEKPVFYAGDVFYGHPDINVQVRTPEDIVKAIESNARPKREKILRFLSYLLHEFYSFGTFATRPAIMPDGSRITATMDVRYRVVRFPGQPVIYPRTGESSPVDFDSILFDRYRHARDAARHRNAPSPAKVAPASKVAGLENVPNTPAMRTAIRILTRLGSMKYRVKRVVQNALRPLHGN